MKFLALSIAAGLVFGFASAAQAQPTDNSELGLHGRSVVGSDYWAEMDRSCHSRASGRAHRFCDAGGAPYGRF